MPESLIRGYEPWDRDALRRLWAACGLVVAWNDPGRDIDRKLAVDPAGLRVLEADGQIVGSVMVGYEGHRGWINYLAVSPDSRRCGLGRRLMDDAEAWLRARGCPKINLQVRETNSEVIAFYRAIGYSLDGCVSFGKRLVDDGGMKGGV